MSMQCYFPRRCSCSNCAECENAFEYKPMQRILVEGIVTAIRAVNAKFVLYYLYGDMFAVSRLLCNQCWNRSDSDDPLDLG